MIVDIDLAMSGEDFRPHRKFIDRWCYLGGGSTTVQKNETDPQIKAMMLSNFAKGNEVADTPFQAYTGERVAGFNPTQLAGQSSLLAAANDPTGTNGLNNAAGTLGGLLNYTPQNIQAGQLSNTDLSPYMNPFQKQVIDASIAQNQYARDQQAVNDNATATAAHAFGGSRQGVQRANTTAAYDRNDQQNLADLNSANFAQARTGAQFDITNRLGASQQNAENDLSGASLRGNAATNLAGLSNQQLRDALTRAGVLASVGDQQQSQQQNQDDAAYEEFMRQLQYPLQQQSIRNASIGLLPTNDGTVTTTQRSSPGIGGILSGILGAAGTAASLGWSPFKAATAPFNMSNRP